MLCTRIGMTFEMASRVPVTLDMLANTSQMCFLTAAPTKREYKIRDYKQVPACLNARARVGWKMSG